MTLIERITLAFLCGAILSRGADVDSLVDAVAGDDECAGDDASCALNALQLRGAQLDESSVEELDDSEDEIDVIDTDLDLESADVPPTYLGSMCNGVAYCMSGGYMVVAGESRAHGMENINYGDVSYYDKLGRAALRGCSNSYCVIMTNPVGHRTQDRFHIHYRYYNGGGAHLKSQLEHSVCGRSGWHGFNKCGHAKVRFYEGQPSLFRAALDGHGGGLAHVGVTAFPSSCGGRGTIVLLTSHCSIEHSISSR